MFLLHDLNWILKFSNWQKIEYSKLSELICRQYKLW